MARDGAGGQPLGLPEEQPADELLGEVERLRGRSVVEQQELVERGRGQPFDQTIPSSTETTRPSSETRTSKR